MEVLSEVGTPRLNDEKEEAEEELESLKEKLEDKVDDAVGRTEEEADESTNATDEIKETGSDAQKELSEEVKEISDKAEEKIETAKSDSGAGDSEAEGKAEEENAKNSEVLHILFFSLGQRKLTNILFPSLNLFSRNLNSASCNFLLLAACAASGCSVNRSRRNGFCNGRQEKR